MPDFRLPAFPQKVGRHALMEFFHVSGHILSIFPSSHLDFRSPPKTNGKKNMKKNGEFFLPKKRDSILNLRIIRLLVSIQGGPPYQL